MAAIVRRGLGVASLVAEKFDFKILVSPKQAHNQKKRVVNKENYSVRKSEIEFGMSFLECGNPRLLRWILQEKELYHGILRDLGRYDEETIVYVLSVLWDKVLIPDSLVPPSHRSVLFGVLHWNS
ncbi:hypothetical protein MKW94_018753 [Papaver nudicaule]|uniref:URB1 N-terminal domain-containing protein n=1 Tax=Papaver nudicaule TaxID=74823 RepID=A0AA41RKX0_PAPNU|nr:hypothetical protein [Papaver nudicaule]